METRLLARLLATARTVTALGAVPAAREVAEDHAQTVRAQVAARLADGSFRVLIDGRALKLALPAGVKPGDVIELKIVNRNGSVHTQVVDEGQQPGGVLSGAARLISSLLSEAQAQAPRQTKPILDLPPRAPAELPEPLARAVERSGMFYESHQARWVDGDFPLERLLQEPQATFAPAGSVASPRETDPARVPAQAPALATEPESSTGEAATASSLKGPLRPADEPPQLAAREALPFVRSQLDALDSRHITWLGEIWPGQSMRWEIKADDSGPRHDDEPQAGWNTRFSLVLPQLGEVGADMAIGAGGIRLNLEAPTPQVAALMHSAAPELMQALASAGVSPVHLKVSCNDAPA